MEKKRAAATDLPLILLHSLHLLPKELKILNNEKEVNYNWELFFNHSETALP